MKVKEVRELSEEVSPMQAVTTPIELPRTALSIAQTGDGLWNLVRIKYDVNTKVVGQLEVLRSEADHSILVEAFKIAVVENGLFNN